jgi:hypothetical protein
MREPPELARDTVSADEVDRRLDTVRARYQTGLLSAAAFQSLLQSFQFKDDIGHLWSPGASSGVWYRWDPSGWTAAQPPARLNVAPETARLIDPLVVRLPEPQVEGPVAAPVESAMARAADVCPNCGTPKTGSRFCTSCGTRF